MKRFIALSVFSFTCLFSSIVSYAHHKCDGEWKEKIMAEKVAFLTIEMNLTTEEAQAFWPIYNQAHKELDNATKDVIMAHKALSKALEEGKKAKEVSNLLDQYLAAKKKQHEIESTLAERYKTVLPIEKVAKLYVGEEQFRRQHIRKLNASKPDQKQHHQANR